MKSKNWFVNLILAAFSLQPVWGQTRLDSLKSLTVQTFREPEIKSEGLKKFELNIKPMNMIEPEIYLFGPSDLVPDRQFDFKPKPHFEFSVGADHHSSVNQYFKMQVPGNFAWFELHQDFSRHLLVHSAVETGKAELSFGNGMADSRTVQTDVLYEIGNQIEVKRFTDFSDSVMLSGSRFLKNRQNYVYRFSAQIRNNPLLGPDLWQLKGNLIRYGNRNTIGILNAQYSKNLTVLNWITDAETDFYQGGLVKIITGLEYESDGWIVYGGLGYSYIKLYGSEKISAGNEPAGQIRLESNSEYFHNRLKIEFNAIHFRPESYFGSPFWFISDTNSAGSNSIFTEKYSANYQIEWIPGPNWTFQVETDYARKMFIRAEDYFVQSRSELDHLKVRTTAAYYFERSNVSGYHEFNQSFNGAGQAITVPYLPEHIAGFNFDFLSVDELNRFLVGGSYQVKTKIFYDPVNFLESKFVEFSEIYAKIEDFHARPVKLFAEIKLYLSDNHYYPGLIFEKYNYRAGLSLKF